MASHMLYPYKQICLHVLSYNLPISVLDNNQIIV